MRRYCTRSRIARLTNVRDIFTRIDGRLTFQRVGIDATPPTLCARYMTGQTTTPFGFIFLVTATATDMLAALGNITGALAGPTITGPTLPDRTTSAGGIIARGSVPLVMTNAF